MSTPTDPVRARRLRSGTFLHSTVVFLSVALVLAVAGGIMVVINTTPSSDRADNAVGVAVDALEAQGGPDGVVASFQDGEITEVAAVGEQSYDADTPFYVGSVSKMFTAAVVARLVDDGLLDLDAPVTEYLPWFHTLGDHAPITLRHLLTQTSGLPEGAGRTDLITPEVSLEHRVRVLDKVETVSEPGTEFHYCTKNFAILALVVESVTGSKYAQVLTEEIIEPLNLRNTHTDPRTAGRDVSNGHLAMFGAQLPASTRFFPGALGDGYLISSAADLATFADVIATGQHRGERFVSEEVLEQMHTSPERVAEDPDYGSTYGFGLRLIDVGGARMLWHEGELATEYADVGVLGQSRSGLVALSTQNGQLYAGDAPFLSGMERLAGGPAQPDDGGFRVVALWMTVLAALVVAGVVTDVMRWPRLVRRSRVHRVLRSTLPRIIVAIALWAGTVFGLGSMLGFAGAVPFPVLWAAAPDLTAVVFSVVGYLVLSAGLLLLLSRRVSEVECD